MKIVCFIVCGMLVSTLYGCTAFKTSSKTEINPAESRLTRTEYKIDNPDRMNKHIIITIE